MHYGDGHFLMLTDCGPLHFFIWNQLARQDLASMIQQLEAVFVEYGHSTSSLQTITQPSAAVQSLCTGMKNKSAILLCVHPSREWHRGAIPYNEMNYSQNVLLCSGGCLLAQRDPEGWQTCTWPHQPMWSTDMKFGWCHDNVPMSRSEIMCGLRHHRVSVLQSLAGVRWLK